MFDRAEGYLGVMVDDLVTRGVTEPYRMFTSRAEYRLTLRADNADQRLTDKGIALGCVGPERARPIGPRWPRCSAARTMAEALTVTPTEAARRGLALRKDGQRRTAFELLSYPDIGIDDVAQIWPQLRRARPQDRRSRSRSTPSMRSISTARSPMCESYRRDEGLLLSDDLDYAVIAGLSNEVRHKLQAQRPRTIGQAGRIDGITPAALTLLTAHIRRQGRNSNRGAA